jgi:hypothetical protein
LPLIKAERRLASCGSSFEQRLIDGHVPHARSGWVD